MENITSSKIFTTRQGTVVLGVIAAVLAAILLIVYVNHYRNGGSAPVYSVLVAKSLIKQGTPGSIVGSTGLYTIEQKPKSDIQSGAFVDPSSLANTAALTDVNPGEQLTTTNFGPATGLGTGLGQTQRAVVVPLDSPGEVGGQIAAGNNVDVWVLTSGNVHEMLQDMYVMAVNGGNVTLRATPHQAGQLIYASANARIWLVLRPSVAKNTRPPVITANSLGG